MPAARTRQVALVVVESPRKALAIRRLLGPGYEVMASLGHVKDLSPAGLGVDVERGFEPHYQVLGEKKRLLFDLRRVARRFERVLLATDPDREGEAIAWHLAEELGVPGGGGRVQRVLFREITPEAVRAAVACPGPLDARRYEAQQARRILDRLVGHSSSAVLRARVGPGLFAGRVQCAALRLLVAREREVRAFRPEPSWSLVARLAGAVGRAFEARLTDPAGQELRLGREEAAGALAEALRCERFAVAAVDRAEELEPPPPPFTTAGLQEEAALRLGFRAAKTMVLARELYEGVDLGEEGTLGLVTYLRTDAVRLAPGAVEEVRRHIRERHGAEHVPEAPPEHHPSRPRPEEAHEAIRPTSLAHPPERVAPHLRRPGGRDLLRLYALVWERFLACQMRPATQERTGVEVRAGRAAFRAQGRVLLFPGWRAALPEKRRGARGRPLPPLEVGEVLRLERLEVAGHLSVPPPRLDEPSLLRALDGRGIGRPSTSAGIVATLLERRYADEVDGALRPTPLGVAVDRALAAAFPRQATGDFTADVERRLDDVEAGRAAWRSVVAEFWASLGPERDRADPSARQAEGAAKAGSGAAVCARCGRPTVRRWGRGGAFVGCSGYPGCKATRSLAG